MKLQDDIRVECAPTDLYRLLSDIERHTDLLPGYTESRIVESHGDRHIVQREAVMAGKVRRWKSEITFAPEQSIYFKQLEGPLEGMRVEWRLEKEASATKLSIIHDIRAWPLSKKWWIAHWVAKPAINRTARAVLEAVKKTAEVGE